jgi:hypothetical protein
MSDKPDILDVIQQRGQNWTGEDRGPEHVIEEFPLYGFSKRAEALDQLDDHLRTVDTSDLRKYSRLVGMRREMGEIHHTLRKAGR